MTQLNLKSVRLIPDTKIEEQDIALLKNLVRPVRTWNLSDLKKVDTIVNKYGIPITYVIRALHHDVGGVYGRARDLQFKFHPLPRHDKRVSLEQLEAAMGKTARADLRHGKPVTTRAPVHVKPQAARPAAITVPRRETKTETTQAPPEAAPGLVANIQGEGISIIRTLTTVTDIDALAVVLKALL
jgi:hypothetical protein